MLGHACAAHACARACDGARVPGCCSCCRFKCEEPHEHAPSYSRSWLQIQQAQRRLGACIVPLTDCARSGLKQLIRMLQHAMQQPGLNLRPAQSSKAFAHAAKVQRSTIRPRHRFTTTAVDVPQAELSSDPPQQLDAWASFASNVSGL